MDLKFKKLGDGFYTVTADGKFVGTVRDTGARRSYGRNWVARHLGTETKHSSRRNAAEALAAREEA